MTFGCSFTGGHDLGPNGAWGHFLSQRLGCDHVNKSGGATNTQILSNVINFCEHNSMNNACIGIQWSEITRREFWDENIGWYQSFGMGTLLDDSLYSRVNKSLALSFIRENLKFFMPMWFDLRENTLRTILAMMQAKAYLEHKGIDFIMFEGINSIIDRDENHQDVNYDRNQIHDLALLNTDKKMTILNDPTFFGELGDMNRAMRSHPKFDPKLNDGHPHPVILEWWTGHLWKHLEKYQ